MKPAYRNPRLLLLTGAMLFTTSAWSLPPASEPVTTRSVTLRYATAKVATPQGAAEMYERLRLAASRVCADPLYPVRRFDDQEAFALCVSEAMDRAVVKISSPMLTALHQPQPAVPDTAIAQR